MSFGHSQGGDSVVQLRSLRGGSVLLLACLLLLCFASCSGEKGRDPATGTVRDQPPIADYGEMVQLGTGGDSDAGEAMTFGGFAANAQYQRGICYDETGDHAKAMADYKEAVSLRPDLANNEDLKRRMGK